MAESTNGLDWLASATPKEASFKQTRRGRQPGKNPMDVHVQASYDKGPESSPLQLDVPAASAQRAERLLRRSAQRKGYSVSVQVWDAAGNVIPLNEIGKLPEDSGDVTLVFKAVEPTEKEKADETASEDSTPAEPVDPFAGSPGDETATETKTRGRKGGKVPAVANP